MSYQFKELKIDIDKVVDLLFEAGMLKDRNKRLIYRDALLKAFDNSQYVLSAWDNNTLIGFVRILTDTSLFATIWNLTVKPSYQNKGIGKELVKRCLNKYPQCHFILIADSENENFYKKLGFETHECAMYLKEGKKRCVIYI